MDIESSELIDTLNFAQRISRCYQRRLGGLNLLLKFVELRLLSLSEFSGFNRFLNLSVSGLNEVSTARLTYLRSWLKFIGLKALRCSYRARAFLVFNSRVNFLLFRKVGKRISALLNVLLPSLHFVYFKLERNCKSELGSNIRNGPYSNGAIKSLDDVFGDNQT